MLGSLSQACSRAGADICSFFSTTLLHGRESLLETELIDSRFPCSLVVTKKGWSRWGGGGLAVALVNVVQSVLWRRCPSEHKCGGEGREKKQAGWVCF